MATYGDPSTSPPSSPTNQTTQDASQNTAGGSYSASDDLTALEAQVLNEYSRLRDNLDALSGRLAELAAQPSSNVSDGMRMLERKTALVCTALKSSVYGIVLQQSIEGEGQDGAGEDGDGSERG